MKARLILSTLILASFSATAQRQVASFDDGSEIEYEVVSDNSEDIKSLWMSWGGTLNGSMHGLGFDYWIPGKAKIDLSDQHSRNGAARSRRGQPLCKWHQARFSSVATARPLRTEQQGQGQGKQDQPEKRGERCQ